MNTQIPIAVQFEVILYSCGSKAFVDIDIPVDLEYVESFDSTDAFYEAFDTYLAENFDLTALIHKHNWLSIINWQFESNAELVLEKIQSLDISDDLKNDILHVRSIMHKEIQHLSYLEQFRLIMTATRTAKLAVNNSANSIKNQTQDLTKYIY